MARFDRAIASAIRAIKRNGQLVTWRQLQRTENPDEPGEVIAAAPIDHNPCICFLPVDKDNKAFINYLLGTNDVKIGSLIGLMGNVSFEPSAADKVIRDGVTLDINDIELLSPNGQKILYTIEFMG